MKRSVLTALCLLALVETGRPADLTDAETEARKQALDVAGAFSNDGFKIRDGHWMGTIDKGKTALLQVNLYSGNRYWFSVGATDGARKLAVTVFDETGAPVAGDPYENGARAAIGIETKVSGSYYVRVQEVDGTPSTFCLLYSYQ
ncbi:MAG: hypothetical protein QM796_09580 [Chthoniobacteraceae bacterium]